MKHLGFAALVLLLVGCGNGHNGPACSAYTVEIGCEGGGTYQSAGPNFWCMDACIHYGQITTGKEWIVPCDGGAWASVDGAACPQ